jgi:predicted ATPase
VSAHAEAVDLARRGLALLPRVPASPQRDRQELALLMALGVSLVATRGFAAAEVEGVYARARALCRQTADAAGLFPVLYGLWNVALLRCELEACVGLAGEMFAAAQAQADPVLLLQGHNVLQQPLLHLGDLAAARAHQEQAFARYDLAAHRGLTAVYGEDPGVGCLTYGAVTLWCQGYPDRALAAARQAVALADALGDPFNRARALYFATFTRVLRREPGPAGELAAALDELTGEHGFPMLVAGAAVVRGWCLALAGDRAAGIALLRQGLTDWQATGAVSHRPIHLALLGEALARDGQAAAGVAAIDEALALAARTGERFLEAELHRLRGEAVLAGGPQAWPAAAADFDRAIEVARRQGARALELRAATSRARLDLRHGDAEASLAALRDLAGWFTEGFDTPDMAAARAVLDPPAN